jgi:putative Holliday junction resolvase
MAIVPVREMRRVLAPGARLMGLDVGTRTVGLALSDVLLMIATPLETIKRTKFSRDALRLADLVERHGVGGLVLGLPVSMDGSEGPRCQGVRQFAENLLGVVERPLAFWDERLSTSAVERMLIAEADVSRKRRAELVDKAAAAWILQGALDAMRSGRPA